MTTVPSLLRRGRIGAVAALALLGALTGCKDESNLISAPDRPSMSTGTYNPNLSPGVRNPPFIVATGKSYRIWYLIENTAPETRDYWLSFWEGSSTLQFPQLTMDLTLSAGERRWVPVDFTVSTGASEGQLMDLYVDAHDRLGDQYGYARSILQIQVANLRPRITFVNGDHHTESRDRVKLTRVRLENPRGEPRHVCYRWLEDEGYYGQTTRPQPSSECRDVGAYSSVTVDFSYQFRRGATQGVPDKQTLQVYTTLEPDQTVHSSLVSTTAAAVQEPNRFYGFTQTDGQLTNRYAIPIQHLKLDPLQRRQYVGWGGCAPNYYSNGDPDILYDTAAVKTHAQSYRSDLYIFLDEPAHGTVWNHRTNSYDGCTQVTPEQYARAYHHFVNTVRGVDPTARFAPAGFEQMKATTTAYPTFGIEYAREFWDKYVANYGTSPVVHEWRFHIYWEYWNWPDPSDITHWKAKVDAVADFGQQYGAAPVVVGFGYPWQSYDSRMPQGMSNMMDYLSTRTGIVSGAWWSWDIYADDKNPLTNSQDRSLSTLGQKYQQKIHNVQ